MNASRAFLSEDINIYFVEFFSLDVFLQFFVVSHVRAHEMSFFIYSLCVDNLISISGFISLFSVRLLYTKQHNLEQDSLNIVFWQHWQRILAMVYLIFSFYQTHTFNMETKKGKKRIKLKKKTKTQYHHNGIRVKAHIIRATCISILYTLHIHINLPLLGYFVNGENLFNLSGFSRI